MQVVIRGERLVLSSQASQGGRPLTASPSECRACQASTFSELHASPVSGVGLGGGGPGAYSLPLLNRGLFRRREVSRPPGLRRLPLLAELTCWLSSPGYAGHSLPVSPPGAPNNPVGTPDEDVKGSDQGHTVRMGRTGSQARCAKTRACSQPHHGFSGLRFEADASRRPPREQRGPVQGPALPLSRSRGTGHPALPFRAQSSVKEGALHPLQRCGGL